MDFLIDSILEWIDDYSKKKFIYSKDEPYTEKGLQHMLSDLMKDKLIGEKL